MGEADRDRLALLDPAVLADGDVGADLDGAALVVEEPEAVAAAGVCSVPGSLTSCTPSAASLRGEGVDVGRGGGAEGDQVDPLVGGLPQPDDVLLGRALGGEERRGPSRCARR